MVVDSLGLEVGYPIDADTIILPETVVEDLSMPAGHRTTMRDSTFV